MSKLKPYPYQEEGIQMMMDWKRCINGDQPGLGKEQPIDAIVKTPSGDKRIGDIKIGDMVFSRDGQPHEVTGVFPQGIKPTYRFTFSDGVSTECGLEHLWTVRDRNRKRRRKGWIVKTTKELIESGLHYSYSPNRVKWYIPMCQPVEYKEVEHYIHPYLLGVLIGDGSISNECVFSNPDIDKDIRFRIMKEAIHEDYILVEHSAGSCPQFRITKKEYDRTNKYFSEIKRLGLNVLSKDKFIPEEYLTGTAQQRMDLLHGLMDTDGSVCKGNKTSFCTTSERLAYDIQKLIWSLGGQAIIHRYDRPDKNMVEYNVNVRTPFNPFWTYRKHFARNIKTKEFPSRGIHNIEYIGEKESVCIMVDEPEHTYLTDNFIVTHNTCQSIVAVERLKATPCLIVCPSSLKINWKREVEKFTNLRPLILSDTNKEAFPYYIGQLDLYDVVICNYESLQKYFIIDLGEKPLKLKNFIYSKAKDMLKSIIIDESHRVKDPSTRQSKIIAGLTKGKEYVYELTGTPCVNQPLDLACQLAILGRIDEFGGYASFVKEYSEERNAKKLGEIIRHNMFFSRSKKLALPDLPELTRTKITTELSKKVQEEYDQCEDDLRSWLIEYKDCTEIEARKKMRMKALVQFMNLRAIAARGKVESAIQFINDMGGEPIVVFCEHHVIVDELQKAFPQAVCVTGRQNSLQKQASIDAFQAGEANIIICSIKAAGVGLTLTASSNVLFVNLCWTMADLEQCEARTHRNGQKNAVNSWVLIGKNTIDTYLYHLIMKKGSMASRVTGMPDEAIKDEAYFDELVTTMINGIEYED